jgi:peptide-methionine (S)-S-oxide reductase
MKTIVLGGGCFWCLEAVFQRVKGVEKVVSGYAGGTLASPTYENHGDHAEVIQLTYDYESISLQKIVEIFLYVHDPTSVNRQGNDIGTQYRSIILVSDYLESEAIRKVIDGNKELWDSPIVTEVNLLDVFYPAEDYHQDYFNQNQSSAYCQFIINPKVAKFENKFAKFLK